MTMSIRGPQQVPENREIQHGLDERSEVLPGHSASNLPAHRLGSLYLHDEVVTLPFDGDDLGDQFPLAKACRSKQHGVMTPIRFPASVQRLAGPGISDVVVADRSNPRPGASPTSFIY
jgi:hypothetical protein